MRTAMDSWFWEADMGIWTSIRNLARTKPGDPAFGRSWGWLMPAGIPVTLETALKVSGVYACVSRIAKAISASPAAVYSFDGRRREQLPQDSISYLLNTRPNPEQTAEKVKWTITAWAAITGNGYAEIQRDGANRAARLWPLRADRVLPKRIDGELVWQYSQTDGSLVLIPDSDMFHLSGPGLDQIGDDMLSLAANAIAGSIASERFTLSYFQNGAHLAGFFEFPGKLDPKVKSEMEKQYAQLKAGSSNAFHTIILEGGMKYQAVSVKASEAQVCELREFQLREIARFYDVPLALLQTPEGAQGYGSNISALWDIFTKMCVRPWAVRWQQEADAKLFGPKGGWKTTSIDLSWLTRGDAEARARAYKIMREIGVDSANDILEQEGRNAIGSDGDVRLVPNNFTTVEGIEKQVERIGKEKPAPSALPVKDPSQDPGKMPEKMPMEEVASDAILALVASAGERYARRLANRKADLERRGLAAEQVESNLAEDRAKARERLKTEVSEARGLDMRIRQREWGDVERFANSLESGIAPRDAAVALIAPKEAA